MDYTLIKELLTALIIGFLIGMQRTLASMRQSQKNFAGSRTFALISLLGFLSGYLQTIFNYAVLLMLLLLGVLLSANYLLKIKYTKDAGITTQIAAIVTFILGLLVFNGKLEMAIFIATIVIVILEIKPRLLALERHIGQNDIQAVTLLLLMSFVILPILPDKTVDPWHLFNPYKTWLMAVIIAAISFIGYVAIKVLGQKHGLF